MKKGRRAALYDPYLDILGGGEKHILSILKVLEENNFDLTIFWEKKLQDDIKSRLNLSFKYLINFQPNIFTKKGVLKKLFLLKNFDYFFYATDGSYFFSSALNNFVFCMVPNKELYSLNAINKWKTSNYRFIANSKFTHDWLKKWRINSVVIHPHVDSKFTSSVVDFDQKEKIILSVGRFFKHLHSKKQEVVVDYFKKLKENYPEFKNYKLVLAGGLKDEDKEYLQKLRKTVGKDPSIKLLPNISFVELFDLYKKASYFWHFAGFGINEDKNPHMVEHMGITPLEAMSLGCITFCYNAGGPKEYIVDGKNGFLFKSKKELDEKMLSTQKDEKQRIRIAKNARETVRRKFGYSTFRKTVEELILDQK